MNLLRSACLAGMLFAALPFLDLYHGLQHAVEAARGDDQSDCLICDNLAVRSVELPPMLEPACPRDLESMLQMFQPTDPACLHAWASDARSPPGPRA